MAHRTHHFTFFFFSYGSQNFNLGPSYYLNLCHGVFSHCNRWAVGPRTYDIKRLLIYVHDCKQIIKKGNSFFHTDDAQCWRIRPSFTKSIKMGKKLLFNDVVENAGIVCGEILFRFFLCGPHNRSTDSMIDYRKYDTHILLLSDEYSKGYIK